MGIALMSGWRLSTGEVKTLVQMFWSTLTLTMLWHLIFISFDQFNIVHTNTIQRIILIKVIDKISIGTIVFAGLMNLLKKMAKNVQNVCLTREGDISYFVYASLKWLFLRWSSLFWTTNMYVWWMRKSFVSFREGLEAFDSQIYLNLWEN